MTRMWVSRFSARTPSTNSGAELKRTPPTTRYTDRRRARTAPEHVEFVNREYDRCMTEAITLSDGELVAKMRWYGAGGPQGDAYREEARARGIL